MQQQLDWSWYQSGMHWIVEYDWNVEEIMKFDW